GTVATNAPTQRVGGATEYVWALPAGFTLASGSLIGTTHTITVNIASTAVTGSVTAYIRYQTAGPGPAPLNCDTSPMTRSQTVNAMPVISSITAATPCTGVLFTMNPAMTVSGPT